MTVSIIGLINQWEQSNLEIFPPSNIYNVLVGTNLNPSGYKFFVVGNSKIEGDLEITGNLSAVIQTLKVIEKTDNVDYLITFITSTGNQIPFYANGQIKYNPSTNKLTVGNLTSNISTSTGYLTSNLVGLLQNNQLQNDSITIDSINLELGSSYTQLALNLVNSTGYLTSNLVGLLQNNQLQNDSITIGSTEFNLGDTNTVLAGLTSVTSTNFIGSVSSIAVTDAGDNVDYYLIFTNSSGSGKTLRINETASPTDTFTYNPSTNKLTVLRVYCGFIEADNYINVKTSELNGLIENLQLRNSIITIGTTGINLGNTKTEIAGLTKLGIGTSSPNQQLEVYGKTLLGTEHTFNVFIYNSTTYNNATETFAQNICFQDDSTMRYGLVAVNTNSALTTNKGASIGFGIADTANNVKIGNSIESITNDVNAITSDLVFKTIGTSDGYVLNTESMRITSAGNVGIGTTNPLDKLSVLGTYVYTRVEGGNNNFGYYGGGNANSGTGATYPWLASLSGSNGAAETIASSKFGWLWYNRSDNGNLELSRRNNSTTDTQVITFARASGNVGIGIINPQSKLHILGLKASTPSIRGIHLGEDTTDGVQAIELVSGTSQYCYLDFTKINSDFKCRIMADVLNGTLGFHTGSTYTERLSINATGNVGIGTTNPQYGLDLGKGYGTLTQKSAKKLSVYNDGTTGNDFYGFGISGGTLNFYADCDTTDAPQMVLNSSGNVGIGYTNPQNKLEVLGDIKCGNSANNDTSLDLEISSSYAYGILMGGWSSGGLTASNATIEVSLNLHIDSPSSGTIGGGHIYLNYYNSSFNTYIRNRVDISDKRIKKDIIKIENVDQINKTFETIKSIGSYTYKYRDIYRENDLDQYGFIAQKVLENYPVACKLAGNNCYLPNIMETLNFSYTEDEDNNYIFTIEDYDLDIDIKYLFYAFKDNDENFDYLEDIEPISINTFSYKPSINKNKSAPVYVKLVLVGTYTDNKLGVSKDKLFQLGFAGVNGLIIENENMKVENENMKNEILELKTRIHTLEENQKKIIQKLNELISPDGWFKNSI